MNIISNCKLCEKHSLHVIGEGEHILQQCIWCGYVSSEKYKGTKKDNKEFDNLTDEMKSWAQEVDGRIWIPSMFTLPDGLIYPTDVDGVMKWNLANMIDIPEDEQKNYPVEGQEGLYHSRMYDTDNATVYENFYEAMGEVNERAKKKGSKEVKLELPKLSNK